MINGNSRHFTRGVDVNADAKKSSLSDQLPVIQKIDLKNGPIAVKDNNMPQAKFNSLTVRFLLHSACHIKAPLSGFLHHFIGARHSSVSQTAKHTQFRTKRT